MAQATAQAAQPQSASQDLWIESDGPPIRNTLVVCFDYVIWVLMGRPNNGLLGPKSHWPCLKSLLISKNYEVEKPFKTFSSLGGNQRQIDSTIKPGDVITMGGYGHTLFVNANGRINHMLQPTARKYLGNLYLTVHGARVLEQRADWRKVFPGDPGLFPDRPNVMVNWTMNMVSLLPRTSGADVQIWRKKKPEPLPTWILQPIAGG